jgi:ketosteroid isomerase-like protein
MNLSKANIKKIMIQWAEAWNRHDLNEVMKLFHEDVVFEKANA